MADDILSFASRSGFLGAESDPAAKRAENIQEKTVARERAMAVPTNDIMSFARSSGYLDAEQQQPQGGDARSAIPLDSKPQSKGYWDTFTDDVKKEGGYAATNLEIGWNNLKKSWYGMQMAGAANQIERVDAEEKAKKEGRLLGDPKYGVAGPGYLGLTPEETRKKATEEFMSNLAEVRKLNKVNQELLKNARPETQKVMGGKEPKEPKDDKDQSWWDYAKSWVNTAGEIGGEILKDPFVVADVMEQSGPQTLAMIATAVAARRGLKVGPTGAATAGGVASGLTEFGNDYAEYREQGLSHEDAWSKAARKSTVVGALDAVSMKSAGKAFDLVTDQMRKNAPGIAIKEAAKEANKQGLLGAAGEAGGSIAAGERPDPRATMLEYVGELGSGPVEAIATRRSIEAQTPERQIADAIQQGVDSTQFTKAGVQRDVLEGMDPNRGVAISPEETVKPLQPQTTATGTTETGGVAVQSQPPEEEKTAGFGIGQTVAQKLQEAKDTVQTAIDKLRGATDTEQTPTAVANQQNVPESATQDGVAHQMSQPPVATTEAQPVTTEAQTSQVAGDLTEELDSQLADIDSEAERATVRQPVVITDQQGNEQNAFENADGDIIIPKEDGSEYTVPRGMVASIRPAVTEQQSQTSATDTTTSPTQPKQTAVEQSPIVQAATEQINRGFGLEDGESVVINEAPPTKRLQAFASAVKRAFGVDVAFVDFGKNGVMRTTTGRTFNGGRYHGYRVAGQKAILLDVNSTKLLDTLGHELTHVLEEEHPEIYRSLVELAKEKIPETKQRFLRKKLDEAVAAETNGRETSISQREFESELVAYMVGEQANDSKFWGDVFSKLDDKTLIEQLMEIINKIVDAISSATKGNTSFIKDRGDALAVKKAAVEAFQQWLQQEQTATAPAVQQQTVAQQANVATEQTTQPSEQTGQFRRDEDVAEDDSIRGFDKIKFSMAENQYMGAINEEPEQMIAYYLQMHGRNINPDLARELCPFYESDPSKFAAAIHEPSSRLAKMVYDHVLEVSDRTKDTTVFLAGGGGSGKGYMAKKLGITTENSIGREVPADGIIIYDAVMGKYASASARIDQALLAGLPAKLYYINTPALQAFKNAIKRAQNIGRTVPMTILAEAHAGASAVIKQLYKEYDGKVEIAIVNNEGGEPKFGDISSVPSYNTKELLEQFQTELERQVNEGLDKDLADAFARTSFSRDLGEWSDESDDARIRSEARRRLGTDGEASRQGPSKSAGASVQKGNAPVTEETNPLLDYVKPEEAEARIRRREARKPGVGSPNNERLVLTKDGKSFAVGKIDQQDWIERVEQNLSKEEIRDARTWYRQLHDALNPIFGSDAPRYALAWLLSQQRASPTKGMTDVLRAADMAKGKPEIKKAGLNQAALISVLKGEMPEGGVGAKLMDFLDSELGKNTRTIVRNDPRGRQPAAIDVWAQRDVGFVDPTVYEYIRKNWGDEAVEQLVIDKTTSGESQYEYGLDFYNDLADYLNAKEYDNGGWTAREIQALGWVTMQKAMGIQAEFVRDIIAGNTRRISIGLAPGTGSVMADKLMGEIPSDVAKREIDFIAKLAGVNVLQNVQGVGAYLTYIEGAVQIDAFASPESVADFMDMVGYAFQQTEVISTRPLKSGKNSALDVFSTSMDSIDGATAFFDKFLSIVPKDKEGNPIAPGFQQIQDGKRHGIRLLNFGGKWSQKQLNALVDALTTTANGIGVQSLDIESKTVVLDSTKNDWTENRNGESYIEALRNRGRLSEARELQRRYVPSRFDIKGDGTIQFSRDITGPSESTEGPSDSGWRGVSWNYRPQQLDATTVTGIHYGKAPVETLQGKYYGTGIKGAEAKRLSFADDERIKSRVYFYLKTDGSMPKAEPGLGGYTYQQEFSNILSPGETMSRLWREAQNDANAFESTIIDSGYDGYAVPSMGMMVLLDVDEVPVQSLGNRFEQPSRGAFSRDLVQRAADGEVGGDIPEVFGIGDVPAVLRALKVPQRQPLIIESSKVAKIVNPESRGKRVEDEERFDRFVAKRIPLTVDELMRVPDWIANPVAILKSSERASRSGFVVVLPLVKEGAPVIAALHPNLRYDRDLQVTEIASAYPKNQTIPNKNISSLNNLFYGDNVLYYNKDKAIALAAKLGVGLPNMVKVAERLHSSTVVPQDVVRYARTPEEAFVMKRYAKSQFSRELEFASDEDPVAAEVKASEGDGRFNRDINLNPTETVKAYKLFRMDEKRPGQLFPLFVEANTPVPIGEWIEAVDSYHFIADNGRPYVPALTGSTVRIPNEAVRQELLARGVIKSAKTVSVKAVAYRPGWHSGDSPMSTHLGSRSENAKPGTVDTRADNQVWVEVEVPADVDWQTEADSRAEIGKNGKPIARTAHITDQVPYGGYYRYKTNPNMTGNWLISGAVRLNRVLTDAEVKAINKKAKVEDLPRATPLDLQRFGFTQFSRNVSLADDLNRQEQFLQQKAEEAGYKDVEEFMAKDYDKFVKAAAQWREENPADLMFARSLDRPLQGDKFTLPVRTVRERVSNKLVDSMSRVEAVQQAVAKQGGKLTDKTNVSESLQRAYNKAGFQLDTFRRQTLEPLFERIANEGIDLSDVANLMYAKHAEEANDYIAMINASFPDAGSGMSTAEARQIIADMRQRPDFAQIERAADEFQAITKMTQDALLDSGWIDQDMADRWNAHYKYYVPLKGVEQVNTDVETTRGGQATGSGRFDVTQNFSKRRLGRSSRATDLIENIIGDYERAVAFGERNKVRQTFLAWATTKENKDDKLWKVNRVILQPQYRKGQMQSPLGYVVGEVNYVMGTNDRPSQTIPVRYNGKVYHIDILDKGMHEDLEMGGSGRDQMLLHVASIIGKPVRILSQLWTAWNPEFIFTNAQRDAEMALASTAVENGVQITKDTFKRVPKMAWTIWRVERGNQQAGSQQAVVVNGQSLTYKDIYDMYRADGGKVGVMDLKTIEDRQAEVLRAMKQARASIKNPMTYHRLALRYLQNMEDFISDMNGAIEQMYRVGAYAAILENGGTREQATKVAMNLTVNFSRKGKWTPLLAPFYMFLNPSVQSVVKNYTMMMTKKGAVLAASLVSLGVMIALANAGNGGDDGEDYWDKEANQNVKLKSLVYFGPNGERYTLPMAYGLGFFVNLGYTIVDVGRGKKSVWEGSRFMANSFTTHFSPLGAMDNMATFLSPSLLDPVIVLSSGKKEDGTPLMPDQPAFGAKKPESELYWSATRDSMYQRASAWLNELGGGSAAVPGKLGPFSADVSPEKLKYATNYVFGGAGRFLANTVESLDLYFNVDHNAPLDKNTVPFVRNFYQSDTGKANQVQFYANRDKAGQALNEFKLYVTDPKAHERDDVRERVQESQGIAILGGAVQKYNDALGNISKMERYELSKAETTEAKYYVHEKYERQRQQLYTMFNKQFYQQKPENKK